MVNYPNSSYFCTKHIAQTTCEEVMAPRLLNGEQPDVTYYNVVRTTLTNVDGQRLTATINGITIPVGILGAAEVIQKTFGTKISIWLAPGLCLISVIISLCFLYKIALLNHFVKESVRIGKKIETRLRIDSDICLTHRFDTHPLAGEGGNYLYFSSVIITLVGAIIMFIVYFSQAIGPDSTLLHTTTPRCCTPCGGREE